MYWGRGEPHIDNRLSFHVYAYNYSFSSLLFHVYARAHNWIDPDDKYHHYMITKEPSASNNTATINFYLDGVNYTHSSYSNISFGNYSMAYITAIETFYYAYNNYTIPYQGQIDDICFYSGESYSNGADTITVPTTYLSDYLGDTTSLARINPVEDNVNKYKNL